MTAGHDDELMTASTPTSTSAATIPTSPTEPDGAALLLRLAKLGEELGTDRVADEARELARGFQKAVSMWPVLGSSSEASPLCLMR